MKVILRNSNLVFQNRDLVLVANTDVTLSSDTLQKNYTIDEIAPGVTEFIVEIDIISTASTAPANYQVWARNSYSDQTQLGTVNYNEYSSIMDFTGYASIFIYGSGFTSGDKVNIKVYK